MTYRGELASPGPPKSRSHRNSSTTALLEQPPPPPMVAQPRSYLPLQERRSEAVGKVESEVQAARAFRKIGGKIQTRAGGGGRPPGLGPRGGERRRNCSFLRNTVSLALLPVILQGSGGGAYQGRARVPSERVTRGRVTSNEAAQAGTPPHPSASAEDPSMHRSEGWTRAHAHHRAPDGNTRHFHRPVVLCNPLFPPTSGICILSRSRCFNRGERKFCSFPCLSDCRLPVK